MFPSSKPRVIGIGKILFVFYLQKPQSGDPEIYSTYAYDRTVLEVHSGGSAPRVIPSPSDPKTLPREIGTLHPVTGCPHTDFGSFPFLSHRDDVHPLLGLLLAHRAPTSGPSWPKVREAYRCHPENTANAGPAGWWGQRVWKSYARSVWRAESGEQQQADLDLFSMSRLTSYQQVQGC